MTLRIALTLEAQADVEEVHAWYAARGAAPEAHPVVHRSIHRALLRRFPYCVFYVVERDRVVVHGCLHARRDPSIWQLRTGAG